MENLICSKISSDDGGGCGRTSTSPRIRFSPELEEINVGYRYNWRFENEPYLELIRFRNLLPDASSDALNDTDTIKDYLKKQIKECDKTLKSQPFYDARQKKDEAMFMKASLERGLELLLAHTGKES